MGKVACAHCGQDWVRCYERKDTGQKFFLCPECESVWELGNDLHADTDMYLNEYLLTGEPEKNWQNIRTPPENEAADR